MLCSFYLIDMANHAVRSYTHSKPLYMKYSLEGRLEGGYEPQLFLTRL
jgi:hypothetical protein